MKTNFFSFFLFSIDRKKSSERTSINTSLLQNGLILLFFFFFSMGLSQTFTALDPTLDGGFENGNDFINNGWTTAQPNGGRRWFARNIPEATYNGSRGAYIGENSTYNGSNVNGVFHFYRDIVIPVGATNVLLNFFYKQPIVDQSGTNDTFYVFTTTTANAPASGTVPTAGFVNRFTNTAQYNNWTAIPTIDLSALAGTTIRLVFTFRSDGSSNHANPAVDNISITYDLAACSGVPTGGTTVLSPTTGAPSSTFNGSVTGSSGGTGITYQWQISENAGGPWTDISGANGETASFTAVPLPNTTRFYRRRMICTNSSGTSYSSAVSFTTTSPGYCSPTSVDQIGLHINSIEIYGISDTPVINNTTYDNDGYFDYTGNPALVVQQAQGEGINVTGSVTGTIFGRGRWKAWVDWNGDGDFTDAGEEVYNVGGIVGGTVGFGFEIPANQTPGNYRMRIRVNNGAEWDGPPWGWYESYGFDYSPCDPFTDAPDLLNGFGETEDYLINVIENCPAKISTVVPGSECNTPDGAEVALSVTSNQPVVEFRWYTTETGGTPYATSMPDGTGMASTWTTPAISNTTVYYVTAFNGSCESTFRTEIKAEVKPTPEIDITSSAVNICGDDSVVEVSAVGDNEIVHLINVNFEDGTLGGFLNQRLSPNSINYPIVDWINRTSIYKPENPYLSWRPALSSGFGPNKFVLANTDANQGYVERGLRSPTNLNTTGFLSLTLKFRMLFYRFFPNGMSPDSEYVAVEISTNNGTNWTELERMTIDVGRAGKFLEKTYDLSAYINQTNLSFRFRLYSNPGGGGGWLASGFAVDDVELYGEKPLEPSFDWISDNPISVYTDAGGTTEYGGGPISTVYFIPDDTETSTYESWNVTAIAELSNGCEASGEFTITNNSKIWDTAFSSWADLEWQPGPAVPTADDCVIIRTPVAVPDLTDGLAKNLKVETGGSLTIQSGASLTVSDFITNEGAADDFIVESDANLLQINPGASNTGEITVRRAATVPSNQYNYWASPVVGQDLYNLYPNIPAGRVMTYNTWNDYFTIQAAGTLSAFGIGYSIKGPTSNSPNSGGGGTGVVAEFIGIPQNESLTANSIPLSNAGQGFNLIGNPYPSNLDLDDLYNLNGNSSAINGTYQFWDNTNNTIYSQQGSGYVGGNYALYNANSGGTPASGGDGAKIPNGIVKPGQGFIVQSLNGTPLILDNTMRTKEVGVPAAPYYKNGGGLAADTHIRKDKFWLDFVTPGELHVKILIGYFEQAEDTFEKFDSKIQSESLSDNFYSFSKDAVKLAIQGRKGLFHDDDVIPLGVKAFQPGRHKIQLQERLGLFVSYQDVYLKDNYLGVVHNLSESEYEFEMEAGLIENRFEIVFKDRITTSGPGTTANHILIQKINKEIVITSKTEKIAEVEIFNLAGWSVYKNTNVNSLEIKIPAQQFDKEIIVIKVRTETGDVLTKKMINK